MCSVFPSTGKAQAPVLLYEALNESLANFMACACRQHLRLHTSLWASRKLILCRHCHHMKLHLTCNRVPEPVSHWLDKQVVPPSNSHHWMSQCRDRLTKNENIYSLSCHFKPLWCSLKHKRKYFEKCLSTFCRFERLWNSLEEEKLHTFLKISSFAKEHHTGLNDIHCAKYPLTTMPTIVWTAHLRRLLIISVSKKWICISYGQMESLSMRKCGKSW